MRGISHRKEEIENKSHNSQSIARNSEKEIFEKKVSWQSWFRLLKYVKRKAGQVMQKLKLKCEWI